MTVLIRPSKTRLHSPGVKLINWTDSITADLFLLKDFSNPQNKLDYSFDLGHSAVWFGSPVFGSVAGGAGLVNSGSGLNFNVAPSFVLPPTMTMLAGLTASFSPTDSVTHAIFEILNVGEFTFFKHSSNAWYFGWNNAGDNRANASSAGTYSLGVPFVAGGTYSPAGTNLYVNGKLLATAGAPTVGSISTVAIQVPQSWGTTIYKDAIHWFAIWNRELNAAEMQRINADPGCLFVTLEDDLFMELVGSAAPPPSGHQFLPILGCS